MNFEELSEKILRELENIGDEYGEFQKNSPYQCPTGCGKCCFNSKVSCAPYELLPLALHLINENLAEHYLEKIEQVIQEDFQKQECIFLNITDHAKFLGNCSVYKYRPLVCRAFGVATRKNKLEKIELVICRVLKDQRLENAFLVDENKACDIGLGRTRLGSVDPLLIDNELPIPLALKIILEKVLLWKCYH